MIGKREKASQDRFNGLEALYVYWIRSAVIKENLPSFYEKIGH